MRDALYFDNHIHLYPDNPSEDYPHLNLPRTVSWQKYLKLAYTKNIFKAITFPIPHARADHKKGNQYILEAFRINPEVFLPFPIIYDENQIRNIDNLIEVDFCGFKEHFMLGEDKNSRKYFTAYDYLQQTNRFLCIHPHMSERVSKIHLIKKHFPKLKIILAHSGRKWLFAGDDIIDLILPELKNYGNLFFDTSTIREPVIIGEMVQAIGSERILFGSDYPFAKNQKEDVYEKEFKSVLDAPITDKEKENILTKNFKALFLKNHWLRRICRDDQTVLLKMISQIDPEEKKFLAVDKKLSTIKMNIKDQRHIHIIENKTDMLGFIRESGRPANGSIIEELYIVPLMRKRGFGKLLLNSFSEKFSYTKAKTFANNSPMNQLLETQGFTIENRSSKGNILNWEKR